jgi:hypothetical protein
MPEIASKGWRPRRCSRRCLSSGHSSRVSRGIVRILVSGVMDDVNGAGCDHGGGAGGPFKERGGAGLRSFSPVGADPGGPVPGGESRNVILVVTQYTTRLLTPDTWDDFAALVEANNGVWGGCWCIGFHPEGISKDSTAAGNREAKLAHVNNGTIHQMLVYRDGRCVGWCQYGPPAEVATIKNPKAYEKGLAELPDWRIGCLFTGCGSAAKAWRGPELPRRWPR